MYSIAKQAAPINIVVHKPQTTKGKQQLSVCISNIHADLAAQLINNLNCPFEQKMQLFDAVIHAVSIKHTDMQA